MCKLKYHKGTFNIFYHLIHIVAGFDTHSYVEGHLNKLFADINSSFEAFSEEMKAMNVWNNVTVIQSSDFARTLNPNGGDGTDHAWGGNYMMMGKCFKTMNLINIPKSNIANSTAIFLSFSL